MGDLLTIEQAAERLTYPNLRRFREWLRAHPRGLDNLPLYTQRGRDKLFSEQDIARIRAVEIHLTAEAMPCRSSSSRPARARARTGRSAGHTSASMLIEAQELTGVSLQPSTFGTSRGGSSVVNIQSARRQRALQPS
jgi:hypothetical protein